MTSREFTRRVSNQLLQNAEMPSGARHVRSADEAIALLDTFILEAQAIMDVPDCDRRELILDLAREQQVRLDEQLELVFDEFCDISEGNDNGCFVQGWIWVNFEKTSLDKKVKKPKRCPSCDSNEIIETEKWTVVAKDDSSVTDDVTEYQCAKCDISFWV